MFNFQIVNHSETCSITRVSTTVSFGELLDRQLKCLPQTLLNDSSWETDCHCVSCEISVEHYHSLLTAVLDPATVCPGENLNDLVSPGQVFNGQPQCLLEMFPMLSQCLPGDFFKRHHRASQKRFHWTELFLLQGNRLFAVGAYHAAIDKYKQAFRCIEYEETDEPNVGPFFCG